MKTKWYLLYKIGDKILVDGSINQGEQVFQIHFWETKKALRESFPGIVNSLAVYQCNPRMTKLTEGQLKCINLLSGARITPRAPLGGPTMPELARIGVYFIDDSVANEAYKKALELV